MLQLECCLPAARCLHSGSCLLAASSGALLLLMCSYPSNYQHTPTYLSSCSPTPCSQVLDDVRPYLIADGGNVDVVGVEDGVVLLQLQVPVPHEHDLKGFYRESNWRSGTVLRERNWRSGGF